MVKIIDGVKVYTNNKLIFTEEYITDFKITHSRNITYTDAFLNPSLKEFLELCKATHNPSGNVRGLLFETGDLVIFDFQLLHVEARYLLKKHMRKIASEKAMCFDIVIDKSKCFEVFLSYDELGGMYGDRLENFKKGIKDRFYKKNPNFELIWNEHFLKH